MIIAIVPLLCALAGLVIYGLASASKPQEIGRLIFFAGLLVTMFALAGKVVKLG